MIIGTVLKNAIKILATNPDNSHLHQLFFLFILKIFKIKNKPFLIYYQYLEEIFEKISFSRKRNRKFNPKNSLESLLLKNPHDLVMP